MEKKVIEIDVNVQGANQGFEQLEQKTKSAKARLRELKNELLNLDEGSAEFQKLSKEAGELQDTIGDLNNTVKNLGSDTAGLDAIMGGMQGITGAFAVGQGALGLFGSENEELEKSLMKVQSAMAMVQGVTAVTMALQKDSALMTKLGTLWNGLFATSTAAAATGVAAQGTATGGATVAMRVFNAVVKANPIGLLVTAILAAVAAMTYFMSSSDQAEKMSEKLNSSLERQNKAMQKNAEDVKKNGEQKLEMMKLDGATEEELFQQKMKNYKNEENTRNDDAKKRKENIEKIKKVRQQAIAEENEDVIKKTQELLAIEYKGIQDIAKVRKDANYQQEVDRKIERNRLRDEAEANEKERIAKQKEANQKARDLAKQRQVEALADLRKSQDIENSLIKNDVEKKIAIENTRFEREMADFKGSARLKEALEQEHQNNLLKIEKDSLAEMEAEIKKAKDKREADKKAEDDKQLADSQARAEYRMTERQKEESELKDKLDKGFITQQEYNIALANLDEKYNREKLSKALHSYDLHLDATKGMLQGIADLTEMFAGKSKQAQEKAFKVQKGLNIAMALIDTYKGATSAFTGMIASVPGPVGIALGVVAAAGVVASGIANIKKISSTKFDGGGGSGGGSGAPSMGVAGGGGGTQAPQFTLAGASGVNQIQQSVSKEQPLKAYVVSHEVTTAQSLDRNRLDKAVL